MEVTIEIQKKIPLRGKSNWGVFVSGPFQRSAIESYSWNQRKEVEKGTPNACYAWKGKRGNLGGRPPRLKKTLGPQWETRGGGVGWGGGGGVGRGLQGG